MFKEVIDKHAPTRYGKRRKHHAPFMNSELRKARNVKAMLHRRYKKYRNKFNWENYRRQRNHVTKLIRQSISHYFLERCKDPSKTNFWRTIKPFLRQT